MRIALFVALVFAANAAWAVPCKERKRSDTSFVALAVPEDAIRPASPEDFAFVTDSTTIDELFAKVGPPDASSGHGSFNFIYCFEDGTELRVITRDRVRIDAIRQNGKLIFKRKKK